MQLLTEFCENGNIPNEQYFEIVQSYFNFVNQYKTFSTNEYMNIFGKKLAKQL